MTVHDLKLWPEYFEPVVKGIKTFELRLNDRNYQVGDILRLREWNPKTLEYTGQRAEMKVTYILADIVERRAFVVMSIIPYHGRKCATCGDFCEDEGECCADERSGMTILPVGGFDENDPAELKPLECWRGM